MKKILCGLVVLLAVCRGMGEEIFDYQKCLISGKTLQDKFIYDAGEEITFRISVDSAGQKIPEGKFFLRWSRNGDDGIKASGKVDLAYADGLLITTTMEMPGFVRVRTDLMYDDGVEIRGRNNLVFEGGAGVDIHTLEPGTEEPVDFDAFWEYQLGRLAEVPVEAEIEEVPSQVDGFRIFAVKVACPGPRPVTGYMIMPENAAPGSLSAVVQYHGYGTYPHYPPEHGEAGKIIFNINAHGFELDASEEYYSSFFESIHTPGYNYAFDPVENSDPETAYFCGMSLRAVRAVEFIHTLPEWNGYELTVFGGSQAGLQAAWAAALAPGVTKAELSVIWCCDLAGGVNCGRMTGWRPAYVPALDYYDPVFIARRITCPVNIFRAGLGDYTSPPSGLAVFYNQLNTPKSVTWQQGGQHSYGLPTDATYIISE